MVLGILFVLLSLREIGHGPGTFSEAAAPSEGDGGSKGGGAGGVPHTEMPSAFNEEK